jgi:hypothetical protein
MSSDTARDWFLLRRYKEENGTTSWRRLPICECGEAQRGPAGGVCGNCAGAIPSCHESSKR